MGYIFYGGALAFLLICVLIPLSSGAGLRNYTISVQNGTTNHSDPNILCIPPSWTDIVVFYAANYFAHAGTVISRPGEITLNSVVTVLCALLFPISGVVRGASAIVSLAKFAKTDLETAARSGALCMVVRTKDWRPMAGDRIAWASLYTPQLADEDVSSNITRYSILDRDDYRLVPSNDNLDIPESYIIHGEHKLPKGYSLACVPTDARFASKDPERDEPSEGSTSLSCSYSSVKFLISLAQSIYATTTLYRSRGDQIERYGYAAFGLTVAPYAIMSVVNLIGNLMVPQYPAIYLVESTVMIEAEKRDGCFFDGTVGKLNEAQTQESLAGVFGGKSVSALEFKSCESTVWEVALRIPPPRNIEPATLSEQTTALVAEDPILSATPEEVTLPLSDEPISTSGHEAKRISAQEHRPCLFIPSRPFYNRNLPPSITHIGWTMWLCVVVVAIEIAILGGVSGFRAGSSTLAQRAWTMTWLFFSIFAGIAVHLLRGVKLEARPGTLEKFTGMIVSCGLYGAPAIGGFIVVGQMFYAYGSCTRIS